MFAKFWKRDKDKEAEQSEPLSGLNWSFLGADMHSHLVPGIDDGAKTLEESIEMLRALKEMGYRKVVTSPHIMIDFYPNTREIILDRLSALQERVRQEQLDIVVEAAAEYYIDEYFLELIDRDKLLTVTGNQVLVEFSMLFEPPMLNSALFKLQTSGYKPIIAHPERYGFFHSSFDRFVEFKDRGCLLQLNLLSLTGYYGQHVMAAAHKMLEKGMYDYCGTDMHHVRHAAAVKAMLETKILPKLNRYPFLNSKLCF